jgi:hypothetical protein
MKYRGYEIQIEQETDVESPRVSAEPLGTFAMIHGNYGFGDDGHGVDFSSYQSWDEVRAAIRRENDIAVILPVYMLDHSGITISTSSFSCKWDSGQIGFTFVTKAEAREMYGWKAITKARSALLKSYLEEGIKELDSWVRGEVYWFKVEGIDSCGGFYGDDHRKSGLLDYAESAIDYELGLTGEQTELFQAA